MLDSWKLALQNAWPQAAAGDALLHVTFADPHVCPQLPRFVRFW